MTSVSREIRKRKSKEKIVKALIIDSECLFYEWGGVYIKISDGFSV